MQAQESDPEPELCPFQLSIFYDLMAVLINTIFKQVGVESEMCSDTNMGGRIFQSFFYFILMDYTKYLSLYLQLNFSNSKMDPCFF